MHNDKYLQWIDQLIRGELDFVEHAELELYGTEHEPDGYRGFLKRVNERMFCLLDERGTIVPAKPQVHLKLETLRRWMLGQLPKEELMLAASAHLNECGDCADRAGEVAQQTPEFEQMLDEYIS